MKEQQINEILEEIHGGSFTRVVYKTSLHPDKFHKDFEAIKVVRAVARFGVNYNNMASVKEKAAQKAALGLATETSTLPWGTWINKFLIGNKGKTYVRLTCSKNNPRHKPKVLGYYVNGREVSEEEMRAITRPSDWTQKDDELDVYNKNIEDIICIGKHYSNISSLLLETFSSKEEEVGWQLLEIRRLLQDIQDKLPKPTPRRSKKRRAKKQGASCSC